MLFTWDTNNLCIVFPSWRITSTWSLIISLLAVMALTAGYEGVRELTRQYESRLASRLDGMPRELSDTFNPCRSAYACEGDGEHSSLLWAGQSARAERQKGKLVKSVLYGLQVFYSFFIM